METAVKEIIQAMIVIMQVVPIGTNLGLGRLMWSMMQGSFLESRGAIFGAMKASGFSAEEIRQSWSAMRYGSWSINEMLSEWGVSVASRQEWKEQRYGSYRVKSVDITGFWRPRLQGIVSRHYHALAQKAMPAIVFGVMISSGSIKGKRIPLLQTIMRCPVEKSESEFRQMLLAETVKGQAIDEVTVMDAEFEVAEIQAAKMKRYVVRLASNCSARLNQLPVKKKQGVEKRGRHAEYGEIVRPLARGYKGRAIPATSPHQEGSFQCDGRTITYKVYKQLVSRQTKVHPDNPTFTIYLFCDPRYKKPLLVATDLDLSAELIFLIYRDRWPVEHPPLAAKQMIGLHRQFVFSPDSCFRLPELALLAGNLLTHVAAIVPPIATGFWDRLPKATPGRLRRLLAQAIFPNLTALDPEVRKKNSVSDHLPHGVDAHRRQKATACGAVTGN